jgi:hypothetical protein
MKWLRIQYAFPSYKPTVVYERLNPKIKWTAEDIHDYVHDIAALVVDVSYRVVNRLPKKELARRISECEAMKQEAEDELRILYAERS